jgi:hypothetical protein
MSMPVQIVEILNRSNQGITRPFLCKGDDDNSYFVKGRGAGRRSLISEYICGNLAKSLNLPIADFEIVDVPSELIQWADTETKRDLGTGLAFASRVLPHTQEFNMSLQALVDVRLRRDILVFDWWVHNADRTLTELGGNPNLLWDQVDKKLVVIDHNQAFDREFNPTNFSHTHVFKNEIEHTFNDMVERLAYIDRLSLAFADFDAACDNVPLEWWQVDDGVPADFSIEATRLQLGRFLDNEFWRIV